MKKLCAAMMLIGLTGVTGCASMSDSNDETVKGKLGISHLQGNSRPARVLPNPPRHTW